MCMALPEIPGRKSRGLSLKVACQVSSQAMAYTVKMFLDDRLEGLESETQHFLIYVHLQTAAQNSKMEAKPSRPTSSIQRNEEKACVFH